MGLVPVPGFIGKRRRSMALSQVNSNPGIRRPRWGGVVEGVAVSRRPLLAYEMGAKLTVGPGFGRQTAKPPRPEEGQDTC